MRRALGAVSVSVLFLFSASLSSAQDRPKIGLALEGGGALGFAHIGVLKWFAQHKIPIDAIAGTSMGGLVGGFYSAGMDPSEIEALVQGQDWDAFLQAQQDFADEGFRRKEDRLAFPNALNFGWRNGPALPSGLNSGQALDAILDRTLLPYYNMKSFDDLPTRFRCVATDLVSGTEKDFDSGSLAFALRATGSIPAIFIPETRGKAVYTDGGSLNNLPVDLAKKMNVDIVIAVYLDAGSPAQDFQQSLLGIAGRTASIMISANERRNIKLADILLTANLAGFSTGDFKKERDIIPTGFAAAEDKKALLAKLSVSDEEWQNYLAERRAKTRKTAPAPSYLSVVGASEADRKFLERALASQVGTPVDSVALDKKLEVLNAQGEFETIRYSLVQDEAGRTGLGVFVVKKANQPPFLQFGLGIDGADPNDVRFGLSTRLTFLNLGGFGSEWRTDVALGETYGVASEYYHPLVGPTHFFVAAHGGAEKSRFDLYDNRTRTAEYSLHREKVGLDVGYAFNRRTELRVGETLTASKADLKLGSSFVPGYSKASGDTSILFRYFGQDDAVMPHEGFQFQLRGDAVSSSPLGGAYRRAEVKTGVFAPVSETGTLWLRAAGGTAFGAKELGLDSFTLGGPFRMGAYGINELLGNQYLLGQLGYSQRIAKFNPLFGSAIYGVAWFEAGKMYADPRADRWPMDGNVGVVLETGLGPVFLGTSAASSSRIKWWFGLGRVF